MNALTTSTGGMTLMPRSIDEAMRLADLMAKAKMVPRHLQGDVGTCFMVVEQALRWQMSPFAVAQCTSNIGGKLMYEGKLVAAAASSCGAIVGEFDYEFEGDPAKPETMSVIAKATRASDGQVRTMKLRWVDAKTDNQFWRKQPEQQLSYASARVWCRRWTPGVILGVYAPEEFDKTAKDTFVGTTIDATITADPPAEPEPPPPPARQTIQQWLAKLALELSAAQTSTEIDEILARADVQKAMDNFRNGAKDQLQHLIDEGIRRGNEMDGTAHDVEVEDV